MRLLINLNEMHGITKPAGFRVSLVIITIFISHSKLKTKKKKDVKFQVNLKIYVVLKDSFRRVINTSAIEFGVAGRKRGDFSDFKKSGQ